MPKGHWGHGPMPSSAHYREDDRVFLNLENTPDLVRGETRLAAEVALEVIHGVSVPSTALLKAIETLTHLAKG